jgi:hypothetical protein
MLCTQTQKCWHDTQFVSFIHVRLDETHMNYVHIAAFKGSDKLILYDSWFRSDQLAWRPLCEILLFIGGGVHDKDEGDGVLLLTIYN